MRVPVWVLDTNVVVSAALTAGGNCDRILRASVDGRLRLAWSSPMLAEYRAVLLRRKFGLSTQTVASLLALFGLADQVPSGRSPRLPDPNDEIFLAAALETTDHVLVTGNTAHFPGKICAPVHILNPAEALARLECEKPFAEDAELETEN